MMLVHIDESLLMISLHMIGIYLVHGWMHLFMVQVDYRLSGTGWCMVDALVYGTD
jgi:surface polysaccharide O-acyltransferase-like enzyme